MNERIEIVKSIVDKLDLKNGPQERAIQAGIFYMLYAQHQELQHKLQAKEAKKK